MKELDHHCFVFYCEAQIFKMLGNLYVINDVNIKSLRVYLILSIFNIQK